MDMTDKRSVLKKFEEYGMNVFTDYPTEKHEHCFMVENMIVYLDQKDSTLAVSFHASSKPEEVGSTLLILKEIEGLSNIHVMESFVYDMNDRFLSGKDAHKLVKQTIETAAIEKFAQRQAYTEILIRSKGHDC
jgi:hypothetical protein